MTSILIFHDETEYCSEFSIVLPTVPYKSTFFFSFSTFLCPYDPGARSTCLVRFMVAFNFSVKTMLVTVCQHNCTPTVAVPGICIKDFEMP